MDTLQNLIKKELSNIARLDISSLVREKLETEGHSADEILVEKIVDQLLTSQSGVNSKTKNRTQKNIALKFTDEDYARVQARIEKIPEIINTFATLTARKLLILYERNWKNWRNTENIRMDKFCTNLYTRWHKGFDGLHLLIELSRDIGADFHNRVASSESRSRAKLNDALSRLHIRAIQIASEIMVLMENGYADGAMARWRTLHEVTCVASVLLEGGEALAERYLAHEIVETRKGLRQYQQFQTQLGYKSFSKRECAEIERSYCDAIRLYGKEFQGDYGWAVKHLNKSKPKFSDIESAAGQAMMRLHYRMASHNVHASTKGIAYRLGLLNNKDAVIAGASNVGFVEPGNNMACSLLQITELLFPKPISLDTAVELMTLTKLCKRIARALVKSQKAIELDEKSLVKNTVLRPTKN